MLQCAVRAACELSSRQQTDKYRSKVHLARTYLNAEHIQVRIFGSIEPI